MLARVARTRRPGLRELWVGLEEVPGFAVGFPAGSLAVVAGVETQALVGGEGFYGQDVPNVEGDEWAARTSMSSAV